MVERLRIAIAKARAARENAAGIPDASDTSVPIPGVPDVSRRQQAFDASAGWEALRPVQLDQAHLERNRVITYARSDPAHAAFDILRTRILRAFVKNGWTRLGITSPDQHCGKTFLAANLALSMSRQPDSRAVLMDLDLRMPSLAKVLGIRDPEPVSEFLRGEIPVEQYFRRAGRNLALGLNNERVRDAAEMLFAEKTAEALDGMRHNLAPDVVIYDLPPMLTCDDVFGFMPQLDCMLLVVAGGRTRPAQVTECERLLSDQGRLLGVVLNQAEGPITPQYAYE